MSALRGARVIPVVTLTHVADAVPLAAALSQGGLGVVEVTMRTPVALEAVRAIRAGLPDVRCGVGTVLSSTDVARAAEAGAQFLVSPGSTDDLLEAFASCGLPALPGAATPSEAMKLQELGFAEAKFFPAEAAGGLPALAALAGPLSAMRWCATGGIGPHNAGAYLALPNVLAVGGSWMVPNALVEARDWAAVTALAAQAATL